MITLDGLVRTFGDVRAVDGISLEIARGEVLGLLGPNGAGKTTTVRLVAGVLAPSTGQVRVGGLDPVADGTAVRRRLGVLPANPAVDDRLTARENLQFAADLYELAPDGLHRRIDALLERFELGGRADERAGGYSTGMRQRLSLARVLLHDPDVLLLDEPTASLDPVAAREVRSIIAELGARTDRTVVLSTHDLNEAQRLCDRVAILEHGRVKTLGKPLELSAATGGAVVQADVHPDDVTTVLHAAPTGGAASADGDGQIRWTGIAREQVPELVSTLTGAGVRVYGIHRSEPTLEDVYLELHANDQQEVAT